MGVAMKFGVVIFPGSNCEYDCYYAVQAVIGKPAWAFPSLSNGQTPLHDHR